jgi:hypothetical protein
VLPRALRALVGAAEMHPVRTEHERRLDVIVHDERDAVTCTEASRCAPALDHVHTRRVLQPPLDDCRAALDGEPRGLQLVYEGVQFHEIFARASSVSGSSAASAS